MSVFNERNFDILRAAEKDHFWFSSRRRWIFDVLSGYLPPPASFLEVGCGTGNVSSFLASKGYEVTGCEPSAYALDSAWPGFAKITADAYSLPLGDQMFEGAGLFDVIEHLEDDAAALKEAARTVVKGGIIICTVPAKMELWGPFDELSMHKRRYTQASLMRSVAAARLEILKINYMFLCLYPAAALRRSNKLQIEEYFKVSRPVNSFMKALLRAEREVSQIVPLPTGTSLICVAKKS